MNEEVFLLAKGSNLLLDQAPKGRASQAIQDQSGAKSGNYLAEFVCVVSSFVFNFIFLAPVRGKASFSKLQC